MDTNEAVEILKEAAVSDAEFGESLDNPASKAIAGAIREAIAALEGKRLVDADEAITLIERAQDYASYLGREFTGDRFTDRGGDGPRLLQLAEDCETFLAKYGRKTND